MGVSRYFTSLRCTIRVAPVGHNVLYVPSFVTNATTSVLRMSRSKCVPTPFLYGTVCLHICAVCLASSIARVGGFASYSFARMGWTLGSWELFLLLERPPGPRSQVLLVVRVSQEVFCQLCSFNLMVLRTLVGPDVD